MRILVLALFVVWGTFASTSATAAYVIAVQGMPPGGVSPPLNPVNGAQCEAFARDSSVYQSRLGEWHQQCLDDNKRCSSNRGGQCSCGACEGLHTARDRFAKESREEGTACFDAVSKARQAIHRSIDTPDGASATQAALLAGINSVAMSQVRRKLAELFATESIKAADINISLRIATSSARIAKETQSIRATCHKQVSFQAGADCEKQILLATHELQTLATSNNSIFIRAIQRNAFFALEQQNRRTLELFSRALKDSASEPAEESGQTLGR